MLNNFMLINFLVVCASAAMIALIWRAIMLDHPAFALRVKNIPYVIGAALYCGFCFTVWLSILATLLYNPLPKYPLPINLLTVAFVTLILRNLAALLMEATGVLTDLHRSKHN